MTSCGFDSLPSQITTRIMKHGISFNLLVVGPTGIGKTTLINSLFDFDYGDSPDYERELTSVNLRIKEYRPPNQTIEMRLTIIETKGLNNTPDKSDSYKPIVDYIDARFKDYLNDELKVIGYNDISDNRVHCCIYIIAPTGSGLKSIDIVTMKQLHQRVCLIPVIGKSDVLTKQERQAFKERVQQEMNMNGIEVYSLGDKHLPIAVAASNEVITENGQRHRVRTYPWGRMYIEKDSEFPILKDLVLCSNMLSLVECTNKVHYEEYRREVTSGDKIFEDFQDFELKYKAEKAALLREIEKLEKQDKERLRSPAVTGIRRFSSIKADPSKRLSNIDILLRN